MKPHTLHCSGKLWEPLLSEALSRRPPSPFRISLFSLTLLSGVFLGSHLPLLGLRENWSLFHRGPLLGRLFPFLDFVYLIFLTVWIILESPFPSGTPSTLFLAYRRLLLGSSSPLMGSVSFGFCLPRLSSEFKQRGITWKN
jgi:hypothetical protein